MTPQAQLFQRPTSRPVLHLPSWAWVNARLRGGEPLPGPAYTIMAHPRSPYSARGWATYQP